MDLDRRATLMTQYRAGAAVVAEALAGATDAELDARPADGGWTAREVAIHVTDSELSAAVRLRRLIAEDRPLIAAYDEELYAERLHYDRPITASVAALAAVRTLSAELLDRLSDEEWQRAGTHSDSGPYSVMTWLEMYGTHAHDHADQIRRALGEARGQTAGQVAVTA